MDNYYFLEMEVTRRQADLIHEAKLARMAHEAQAGKAAADEAAPRAGGRSPIRRAARWVPMLIARLFTL